MLRDDFNTKIQIVNMFVQSRLIFLFVYRIILSIQDYGVYMQQARYIDAHCHIQNAADSSAAIADAVSRGVCGWVCNATCPDDWATVTELGRVCPSVRTCIGVHPWYITRAGDHWGPRMRQILASDIHIMVGEIGLDTHHPDMDAQMHAFGAQLDIAYEFGRGAHIHCVGAWNVILDTFHARALRHMPPAVVMHAYTGSANITDKLAGEYGAYFSFSPMVMDTRHRRMRDAVRHVPINRILVESDSDNPSVVPDVVAAVAEIRGIPPTDMANIIYDNTHRILR